jgi:hypothetical protein
MKPVPEINKSYKFYADGKITATRQYDATIESVLSFNDSLDYQVHSYMLENTVLVDAYRFAMRDQSDHMQIFAPETDYFIGCKIPNYSDNTVWFCRDTKGGWASLALEDYWQAGVLDVDGEMTKQLEEM